MVGLDVDARMLQHLVSPLHSRQLCMDERRRSRWRPLQAVHHQGAGTGDMTMKHPFFIDGYETAKRDIAAWMREVRHATGVANRIELGQADGFKSERLVVDKKTGGLRVGRKVGRVARPAR